MCPLRIIFLFLSATLAGYFAWKTVRSASSSTNADKEDVSATAESSSSSSKPNPECNLKMTIRNGFWVFMDMASGRFLCRNLRVMNEGEKGKVC
ncbi:uncharacterized protein LOC122641582 [Telopea speciosissima]|uniref:uncharacterized protein LOC122641582 n=1 Tax=Telopea speciosissima TaxID=54955 RepID=UPI001CC505A2|nr:uncharacterized protein LOC122641582 [Telopea speciosissima]